jgi:DNA-binding beta-propeller fold protein YncE
MRSRLTAAALATALVVICAAGIFVAQRPGGTTARPGAMGGGVTLLPNGWRIAPAGKHFPIGDKPLNMVLSPDGHSLIVTNNGYQAPTLRVVDLDHDTVSAVSLDDAWLGLAWHPDGRRLLSSGAASNTIQELTWNNGRLRAGRKIAATSNAFTVREGATRPAAGEQTFVGGIAISEDGRLAFAVHVFGQLLAQIDLESGTVTNQVDLPAEPYTCLLSADGRTLYVSLWGGGKVLMFDPWTLASKGEIVVGEHPNAMVLSTDGARLFVACANTNAVWTIDTASSLATEQIAIALYPKSPPGSTPNAVAVSPDGTRLAVANADNNTVALVDITKPDASRALGFLPTGWYPTGVLFSQDGSQIFVLSGKGLTSSANPRGSHAGISGAQGQYTGSMLEGALSIVETPDDDDLEAFTRVVYSITPYSDATRLAPAAAVGRSPIPARVGDASPITHVFYVIRENRTYDQILGDLEKGNGDPTLALFGEQITPNAHALAREFVTLDNFYVNAEVSYDGHAFSTGAIANDFVEKIWPINYGGRGGVYLSEGGGRMRTPFGNIAAPANGYIWDAVVRAGRTVRSYGEFVDQDTSRQPVAEPSTEGRSAAPHLLFKATVPGLEGRIHPRYYGWDLSIPDNRRIDIWLEEFREFEKNGSLPSLSIMRLGGDHTSGTRAGAPTPRAMIAENDLALGRLVDAVSHSPYWAESAIFVLEDDAQNGPDHVDAHRSVALIASPYVRRGIVDSTLYTTSSMLRTIELILGAEPMTQYDAAATPMYESFRMARVDEPYTAREARIPLDETNRAGAPGAAASAAMNFDDADMTPELELNQILWQSVHGPGAVMPPPVHAAFIRPRPDNGDADDDDDDRPAAKKPAAGTRKDRDK